MLLRLTPSPPCSPLAIDEGEGKCPATFTTIVSIARRHQIRNAIMSTKGFVPFLVAMMLLTGVCNTLLTKYQVRRSLRQVRRE